jgi:hypothetical protein
LANGNKPTAKFANPFTRRVAKNSRIAYYPYPGLLCGAGPAASPSAREDMGYLLKLAPY